LGTRVRFVRWALGVGPAACKMQAQADAVLVCFAWATYTTYRWDRAQIKTKEQEQGQRAEGGELEIGEARPGPPAARPWLIWEAEVLPLERAPRLLGARRGRWGGVAGLVWYRGREPEPGDPRPFGGAALWGGEVADLTASTQGHH
jgi:hypothetical protein